MTDWFDLEKEAARRHAGFIASAARHRLLTPERVGGRAWSPSWIAGRMRLRVTLPGGLPAPADTAYVCCAA